MRIVGIVGLPIAVGLFYWTAYRHFSYTPDDTYIYLQFARNMLRGDGVAFNPGVPTYGFTSPLWLLTITALGRTGIDLLLCAKALDLLFAAGALIAFYFLASEIVRDRAIALLATIVFSLNVWLLRWAGTGMETSLAVLLVLLTILSTLRNHYPFAALFAALGTLARPEIGLLFPLILGDLFLNSRSRTGAFRQVALMVAIFGAIVLPWLLYAQRTFGSVVPNTALAKAGFHFSVEETSSTAEDIGKTLLLSDGAELGLFAAVIIALALLWKRLKADDAEVSAFAVIRQSFVGVSWILLLPLFYVVTGVNVVSRYLLLITPLMLIYMVWYLTIVLGALRWQKYLYYTVFVVAALMMLQSQAVYRRYVMPGITAFEFGMESSLIPIGQWLRKNTPPQAVVYTPDVGAIGFYSERTICDGAGLVTPGFLPAVHEGVTQESIIEEGLFSSLCGAGYVVDRSFERERWRDRPDFIPLMTRAFPQMGIGDSRINYYTLYKVDTTSKK